VLAPNLVAGRISFQNQQSMLGADCNLAYNYLNNAMEGTRWAVLLGGRFLSLSEKLKVEQSRTTLPDPVTGFTTIEGINENFTTYNRFYGGQIGGQVECCMGPLQVQVIAKVAAGVNNETASITGGHTLILPANPALGLATTTVAQSPYTLLVGPGNYG